MDTYFIVEPRDKVSNTNSSQQVTVTPPSDESTLVGYETAQPLTESATESMTTAQEFVTPVVIIFKIYFYSLLEKNQIFNY